jgi:hypothetical protein
LARSLYTALPAILSGLQAQLLLTGKFGWLMSTLLCLGLISLARHRLAAAAFSAAWLVLPTFISALAFMPRGLPLEPRFIIPVLPVYLMLVAEGITTVAHLGKIVVPRLRHAEPALATVIVAVLLFFIGARTRAYYAWPKESWREAIQLIARYADPRDAIVVPHMEEVLGIYAPSIHHTLWEPKTLAEVQIVARQRGRLWLIWSPYNEMGNAERDCPVRLAAEGKGSRVS